jgi:ATP-dependent DNA helicase RecQ
MNSIAFIDTEINPDSQKILDIGGIKDNGNIFHSNSINGFINFLKDTQFICGHNILNHDLKYIQTAVSEAGILSTNVIDTLFLSPLLFPARPYHALLKDDKLQTEDKNNPLNDSKKARDLFYDEKARFEELDESLQQIFYLLLKDKSAFCAFFNFLAYKTSASAVEDLIREKYYATICGQVNLAELILEYPIPLAYCLALINCQNRCRKRNACAQE